MQARLSTLRHGVYGPIFDVEREGADELDLAESLSSGITYISLPAMASSEDSELMARVVIQDLKQIAAERISRLYSGQGEEVTPTLLVMDEFASLKEAEQIKDLLGQARESKIATVISSLHLPKDQELKKVLLAAGLLVTHEVGGEEDAKEIAKTIGSREKMDVSTSYKPDDDEDEDRRITGRKIEKYLIEPRDIQRLGRGKAAMKLRYGDVQRVERVKIGPVYRPVNEEEGP